MLFSERFKLVHAIEGKDYGSAGIDADSINMSLVHRVCFLLTFGAITGNSVLKLYGGASAGSKTTAIAFQYRLASGDYKAASADLFGSLTDVASSGLTLTAASFDHRLVVVEIEGNQMPADKPYLTLEIDNTATVMNVGAAAIGESRFAGAVQPSAI